jgi:8-oxo-dGTP pyrophosphatase MutT (NUDIX family)
MTTLASGIILYRLDASRLDAGAPRDGSVRLLLLRNADNGHWGFAKGRRDREDAHEVATALREVREETGYDGLLLHPGFRHVLEYTVRQGGGGTYAKRVVYFLAQAPAHEPLLSREHDVAAWADGREVERRLSYGQLRDLGRAVFTLLERP